MDTKNNPVLQDEAPVSSNTIDYLTYLEPFNIVAEQDGFVLCVGEIPDMQGWIFYIPVRPAYIESLLEKLIPYLSSKKIPFTIPLNSDIHHGIKEGAYGYELQGKVVCIYPTDQTEILNLAKDLSLLTKAIQGTPIPTAAHLDGLVYTRYSAFIPINKPDGDYFHNNVGELIKDEYTVPYLLPSFLSWPFSSIANHVPPEPKNILKKKYFIVKELAVQPKGRVIQGLFKKGWFRFKQCLIKEGRPGMFTDNSGRDIVDRLLWQQELHLALADKISLPHFIDLFEEDGNTYFVTDFVEGMSYSLFLDTQFKLHSWLDLPANNRLTVLDYLRDAVSAIGILHQEGYVHRDISVNNFMIDNKGKLVLIDIELAYSVIQHKPDPPFQIGTPGYMSPEQKALATPDFKQDVYSLGALMLFTFFRLAPKGFKIQPSERFYNYILFFTGSEDIAELITSCMDVNPLARPTIQEIMSSIAKIREQVKQTKIPPPHAPIDQQTLSKFTKRAVAGLYAKDVADVNHYWTSQIISQREDRNVFIGLYKGIGGIFSLLSDIKRAGLEVDSNSEVFQANWEFLEERYLKFAVDTAPGLYNDSSGVAVSLANLLDTNLIEDNETNRAYILNLLQNVPSTSLDVANGVTGYGIAILRCMNYLPPDFINERLSMVINALVQNQRPDGSWIFPLMENPKGEPLTGFEIGIAGMSWFLLVCGQLTNNQELLNAGLRAVNWLKDKAVKYEGGIVWHPFPKSKDLTVVFSGSTGVILTLIKAYEITGDATYKDVAEKALAFFPSRIVMSDYTFDGGLVGIGEIYLEAYRVFKNVEWKQRAAWIAGVFLNSDAGDEDVAYWIQNDIHAPYVDLMIGNGGVIHFLLRYLYPEKVGFMVFQAPN